MISHSLVLLDLKYNEEYTGEFLLMTQIPVFGDDLVGSTADLPLITVVNLDRSGFILPLFYALVIILAIIFIAGVRSLKIMK